jgi:methionyl-tRNA formyltransferase
LRVVLISQIAPAAIGYYTLLRGLGHEPIALLCTRERADAYGGFGWLLAEAPSELDVVIPGSRERIAPLLRPLEPDLVLCTGFPWKIPAEALEVPQHGVVNGHPSLLPRYRGPSPMSWAIRNGESEVGFTFHYMDAELDTGNVLAQARIELGDEYGWDELGPKLETAIGEIFPTVLERVEQDDPGDPQPEEGASYFSFFEPEYAWIDWSRPALEIERQVRAWRFHSARGGPQGALTELDGETVRVLRISTEPADGPAMECGDGTLWIVETEPA